MSPRSFFFINSVIFFNLYVLKKNKMHENKQGHFVTPGMNWIKFPFKSFVRHGDDVPDFPKNLSSSASQTLWAW